MASRNDLRTRTPNVFGKPNVTLPANDPRAITIVETRTEAQWTAANTPPKKYLIPHDVFKNALLVSQAQDPGDNTDAKTTEVYEVLPGAIQIDIGAIQDTGVPVETAKQRVAANDIFDEGELIISGLVIQSIALGSPTKVTFTTQHRLPPRCYVNFISTNSTPVLDGVQRIVSVPDPYSILIAVHVTGAGTAGTMGAVNPVIRELRQTDNVNVLLKVDSMIACADITVFNEDDGNGHKASSACWEEYPFPDALRSITVLTDDGSSDDVSGTGIAWATSKSGEIGLDIQNGFRGPCVGRRIRIFSSGPFAAAALAPYAPTIIMPSMGTAIIKGTSQNHGISTGGFSNAESRTFKQRQIPPVVTCFVVDDGISGSTHATPYNNLTNSFPKFLFQGQIITRVEEPQKLAVAAWMMVIKRLVCPYTSGLPPGDFYYPTIINVYAATTAISSNTPVLTGLTGSPTSFACTGLTADTGLTISSTTGVISGTTNGAHARTLYTITATLSGKTIKAYIYIQVV